MKITNNYNIPDFFLDLLSQQYKPKSIDRLSASTIMDPIQKMILEYEHWDDLEEDAASRVNALIGTAIHDYLENNLKLGGKKEVFLSKKLSSGVTVSGKADHILDSSIIDFKSTKVYRFKQDSFIKDLTIQLNIYKYLANNKKTPVDTAITDLYGCVILKDWSETSAIKSDDYPQSPIVMIKLDTKPDAYIEAYINARYADKTNAYKTYKETGSFPPVLQKKDGNLLRYIKLKRRGLPKHPDR